MNARRQAILLLLPCALTLVVLFLLPQLLMFESSLGRRDAYGGIVHQWGPSHYLRALEPLYRRKTERERRALRRRDQARANSDSPLSYAYRVCTLRSTLAPRIEAATAALL